MQPNKEEENPKPSNTNTRKVIKEYICDKNTLQENTGRLVK